MTDSSIHAHIDDLIAEEKTLRERLAKGEISVEEENARLSTVEADLDRCWDLLRQRDALREFGKNPDEAQVRSAKTVEGYQS
ncbi:DUF2630 family protein [Enemella evansiae]|uniref:DUF2630 family protein n=1 Tax=Enemella evansiae TaxID=2016499 RepID=A0A255GQ59_9ACTN|nr:DUF2630 family protein [Enemella evansiae]OYN94143.1 hypothetical protein CGZ96_19255 [Enemella evansiae]OYN95628.1 hypothetical protein CGZ95_16280 [Enemella evansiae]OYO04274.1 hypothetical protein CGZ97_08045 [Enemella evansiae]OYO09444.1 hypothetical protein BI335_18695 [Enemella evansiae]OYO09820.1 hypothetical protein CGZ98_11845 [Enemella evansiae]